MSRKRWAELNADLKQIERLTNAHRGELVNPSFQNTEEIKQNPHTLRWYIV